MGAEEPVRPCPGQGDDAPPILRFEPVLPPLLTPDRRTIVLDTTWTPPPDDAAAPRSIRDVAQALLVERDLIEEAADHLDGWAAASMPGPASMHAAGDSASTASNSASHRIWPWSHIQWRSRA